jgi:hypothetical protein
MVMSVFLRLKELGCLILGGLIPLDEQYLTRLLKDFGALLDGELVVSHLDADGPYA